MSQRQEEVAEDEPQPGDTIYGVAAAALFPLLSKRIRTAIFAAAKKVTASPAAAGVGAAYAIGTVSTRPRSDSLEAWLKKAGKTTDWYKSLPDGKRRILFSWFLNNEPPKDAVRNIANKRWTDVVRAEEDPAKWKNYSLWVQAEKDPGQRAAKPEARGKERAAADTKLEASRQRTAARSQLIAAGYDPAELTEMEKFGAINLDDPRVVAEFVRQKRLKEMGALYGISEEEANLRILENRGTGEKVDIGPSYQQVDRYTTFSDALLKPHEWGAEQVGKLQDRLVAAGLLDKDSYHPQQYDAPTTSAYRAALLEAARQKKTVDEVLTDYTLAKPVTEDSFAPPPFIQADPEQVELFVRQQYETAAGKSPDPETLRAQVGMYRSWEAKAYSQQVARDRYTYEVQTAQEKGTPMPAAPTLQDYNPEARAEAAARETPEAEEYEAIQFGLALRSLLRGE